MPGFLTPDLNALSSFELNLSFALRMPPSEMGTRLTARDFAFYRLWWERFGSFEPLVAASDQ